MAKLHLAKEILDIIYPIGSVYISVNATDPSTLFGGGWTRITGRFLLGADGNTYKNGATGGQATHTHTTGNHTLTIDEIPSHNHLNRIPHTGNAGQNTSGDYLPYGGWNANPNSVSYYIETSRTGGGKPHNHGNTGSSTSMPPYLVVYMWKRTS